MRAGLEGRAEGDDAVLLRGRSVEVVLRWMDSGTHFIWSGLRELGILRPSGLPEGELFK